MHVFETLTVLEYLLAKRVFNYSSVDGKFFYHNILRRLLVFSTIQFDRRINKAMITSIRVSDIIGKPRF